MHLSNYKTEYLQNALKHLNKKNETYGFIEKELQSRNANDYNTIFDKIQDLKNVYNQYQTMDNVTVFVNHYKLSSTVVNDNLRSVIELDIQKISQLLKLYSKYERQYIWENVAYNRVYSAACKILEDYANFQNDIIRTIESWSNKEDATVQKYDAIHNIMDEHDVDFETGDKLYQSYQKFINDEESVIQQYHEGKLTKSQHDAIVNDMYNDYTTIAEKIIKDNHSKQEIDKLLTYLDYPFNEFKEVVFLKHNDILIDNVDRQNLALSESIDNHVVKVHDALLDLKHDTKNSKTEALKIFNDTNHSIYESFKNEWLSIKKTMKENNQKAKQFLLDMMIEDENNLDNQIDEIFDNIRKPDESVSLKNVKETLDSCYDSLNVIMDKVHDVYDALDTVPKNKESSLSDIILMLMDMKKDYVDKQFTERSDLYNYLKLYKTIQLSVGRFRGITDALHKLSKSVDIIVVPENHHKQQYSQLPCVVINPNELHLIPEHCPIGNIYIDYHRTMFDTEIKNIYEKLGRSPNQFFIMVG